MSKLKFNDSIFTNVKKFENNIPLGVLVSGKLNQYNHQGYPILDAIDIDWNGAYVKNLNTYIYTTEDLINCLNISYSNFGNYVSLTYFENVLGDTVEDLEDKITYSYNNSLSYSTYNFDKIINIINELKDDINSTTNIIDKSFYYKVEYDDIVENNKLKIYKKYYTYDKNKHEYDLITDINEIIYNPNQNYYINVIEDVLDSYEELSHLSYIIGDVEYNEIENTYTYSGLLEKIHKYDIVINNVSYQIENVTYLANNAYDFAYSSYSYIDDLRKQVENNTYNIGYHTSYNVYKPITELTQTELSDYLTLNNNNIYKYDNITESYIITSYNNLSNEDYYVHYNKIIGTGIEKEIENLDNKIYENSYLLYKLDAESDDPDYINIYITPDMKNSQERTIRTNIYKSDISSENGTYTTGLITNTGLNNSFSYLFNWKILNKE